MSINDQLNALEEQKQTLCNTLNDKLGLDLSTNTTTLLDINNAVNTVDLTSNEGGGQTFSS